MVIWNNEEIFIDQVDVVLLTLQMCVSVWQKKGTFLLGFNPTPMSE